MTESAQLKFLLDTNVLIPAEPVLAGDEEPGTEVCAQLIRGIQEGGHRTFLHPASQFDIQRDTDPTRRRIREIYARKYPFVPDPPSPRDEILRVFGDPIEHSNDWVDAQLVAALDTNVVNFLVTEDQKLNRRARRLGLASQVLGVSEAVSVIYNLLPTEAVPPPAVQKTVAHSISEQYPILESFRRDYGESFDRWFRKCREEHRTTWLIPFENGDVAAFSIVKEEDTAFDITGKILKICSFKVSEDASGSRYSELLLKAIFDYAQLNNFEWLYVTAFEKHELLIERMCEFGFCETGLQTELGEEVLFKALQPPDGSWKSMSSLHFHKKFGPSHLVSQGVAWYIIPIQPRFANKLFPETNTELFGDLAACGNALRKAYLCNANIRRIEPGDVLVFYRSHEQRALVSLGVAEEVYVSDRPESIAQRVAKRTVYSLDEIEELCAKGAVLSILFRQPIGPGVPVPYSELESNGVFSRPPQSIARVREEVLEWLRTRLQLPRYSQ